MPVHFGQQQQPVCAAAGELEPGEAGDGACVVVAAAVGHPELRVDVSGEQGAGAAGVRDDEPDPVAVPDHEAGMVRRRPVPGHCEGGDEVFDAGDGGPFSDRAEDLQSAGVGDESIEPGAVADAPSEDGVQLP